MSDRMIAVKCVVWDLDHTLWDGILLEDPEVRLRPGMSEVIRQLDDRGIIQSIASRNNAEDALNQLRLLELEPFFLYPQIHWEAKSASVRRIAEQLNIGTDTILFIDDQPFERDEVRSMLPEVDCIAAEVYMDLLTHPRIACSPVTAEGSSRRTLYMADNKRKQEEAVFQGSAEQFLRGLQMEFTIFEAAISDLQRAEELTVRTNQLNATGIPYSYEELAFYQRDPDHKLFMCELTDKYGSYGKIGLALVDCSNPQGWHLKLLLMSCRVMSRGVGTIFLNYLMKQAKQCGNSMTADFRLTGRNKQMYVAYMFAGFVGTDSDDGDTQRLVNHLSRIQPYPVHVQVREGRQPFVQGAGGTQ